MRLVHRHLLFPGLAGAVLIIVAGICGVADPFGLHNWIDREGFNHVKPFEASHRRMIKPYRIREYKPSGLILGTSRAEHALSPDHPAWRVDARPVYNSAFAAANPYEMRRMLQHATACGNLRQVVVGIDFFSFNWLYGNRPDFSEDRLAIRPDGAPGRPPVDEWLSTLFSWDSLSKSWSTLTRQHGVRFLQANGQQNASGLASLDHLGARERFLITELDFVKYQWPQGPEKTFVLRDPVTHQSYFDEVGRMIAWSKSHGIDIRFFISPVHARLLMLMREAGWWPFYLEWLQGVANVTEEAGVGLWNFSGINSVTSEPVPPLNDLTSRLAGYRDASHYTPTVGDRILDKVLGSVEAHYDDDFGVRLTASSAPDLIARLDADVVTYAATHPDDVSDAHALATLKDDPHMSSIITSIQTKLAGNALAP